MLVPHTYVRCRSSTQSSTYCKSVLGSRNDTSRFVDCNDVLVLVDDFNRIKICYQRYSSLSHFERCPDPTAMLVRLLTVILQFEGRLLLLFEQVKMDTGLSARMHLTTGKPRMSATSSGLLLIGCPSASTCLKAVDIYTKHCAVVHLLLCL